MRARAVETHDLVFGRDLADDWMVELDLPLGVVLDVVALPEAGEVGALVQQLGDELLQVFGFRLSRGKTPETRPATWGSQWM